MPAGWRGVVMADVVESVDIERAPEDVAAYLEDLARHGEWQAAIVDVTLLTEGPVRVGTRGVEKRRVGPRDHDEGAVRDRRTRAREFGKLFAPVARRQAANDLPADLRTLEHHLETST